jgi:hypothetical protein
LKKTLYLLYLFIGIIQSQAQDIDFEAISKSTDFKVNGGISANSVFYNSNERNSREPFTYFLQGNLNFSWLTFSMPLSYSFTNQGDQLDYKIPYNLNRISIHPKYKWISAHIGDVAMTYSPYTLNGHQFTGLGLDITPDIPLKFSIMGGQLLKAVDVDEAHPEAIPSFKRMGYGTKIDWEKEKYKIGVIGFYAKDDITSLASVPDDKNVTPKENLVVSIGGEVNLTQNVKVNAEYASSAITQDIRDISSSHKQGLSGLFLGNVKSSTEYFNAFKSGLEFKIEKMQWGVGYERIDPGYQTLGAYYFNNDLENITLNGSRPFWNDRLNLAFNVGYQRDNLNSEKEQKTKRLVGAVNASLRATDKITLTGSYSNFSTYTNRRLNQFDEINNEYDPNEQYLQTFKYEQLSQNANFNINWDVSSNEKLAQNINVNYSLAASANKTDGVIRIGQASNFHNINLNYNINFPKRNISISTAVNYTYADIAKNDSKAWGPTVNISKRFLDNKLNSTLGVSYNTSSASGNTTDATNIRASTSYTLLKKHNFNLNIIQLLRTNTGRDNLSEFTLTFGYNYSFDIGSPKVENR